MGTRPRWGLANYANEPVKFTFLLAGPATVNGARAFWSSAFGFPAYRWSFECADTVGDLDAHVGSYRLLAQNLQTASDVWSQTNFNAVTCQVFRFIGERLTGDHYLHVNELEILLTNPNSSPAKKLVAPLGLALDGQGRAVVADAAQNAVIVLDDAGAPIATIGQGTLLAPEGVAVDGTGKYVIADTGNSRVVRFSSGGALESVLAGPGSGDNQVSGPSGIAIDNSGRILVADRGNHRILRLLSSGGVDLLFGQQGHVGGPGPTGTDSGFNAPNGVAWDAVRSQVLVADTGNNRIQVLDVSGTYVRTVDAVYKPSGLVAAADGTLYAVGDGGTFPARSGSVRAVSPGASFVTDHVWNGDAGVGRKTGGVALRADGSLLATDRTRGVLLRFPVGLGAEIEGIRCEVGATYLTVRYRTAALTATRVYYGESQPSQIAHDPTLTRDHQIQIPGLSPLTRYVVSVAYPRSQDGQPVFSPSVPLRTEPAGPGQMSVMRLRTAGLIYTYGFSVAQIQQARDRLSHLENFYFRHSGGRLHLDVEIVEVVRQYTASDVESFGQFKPASAQADLVAAGYGAADQFDEVVVFFGGVGGLPGANLGGGATMFGRNVGYCSYVTPSPFVVIHEVNHTIDTIYNWSGYPQYEFNHGLWAVDSDLGFDLIVNGAILRDVPRPTFAALTPPFTAVLTVADADGDELTDDPSLPLNESSSGADPTLPDSDFDGVGDLEEAMAGTHAGTLPKIVDSDSDGSGQGADRLDHNPTLPLQGYVKRATPVLDGAITIADGWTLVSDQVDSQNPFVHDGPADPNNHADTRVWGAWDDNAFYLAVEFSPATVTFKLDGNGDGWFRGYDNHYLRFTAAGLLQVAGVAADKDLMFAIHPGGEWSEIFDDSAMWQQTPPNGLGLERLIPPGSVGFSSGPAPAGRSVVELRIPASARRNFLPRAGQEVRIYLLLDSDVLYDEDRFARLLLVEPADADGDGLGDLQEIDLGSDPDAADADGDGLTDPQELAAGLDPSAPDTDGDSAGDATDCAGLDPGSLATPAEITGLIVGVASDLQWIGSAAGTSTVYDLSRQDASGPGSMTVCLSGAGLATPSYLDAALPLIGKGWRYLVKGRNRCGSGTWGYSTGNVERVLPPCP